MVNLLQYKCYFKIIKVSTCTSMPGMVNSARATNVPLEKQQIFQPISPS